MNEPLVSVVMPVYQKEKYVEECIKSILDQTYRNIELICIDDYSQDNSGIILKRMADSDSRITIITNGTNKGASVSRNIGIKMAKGRYLSVLDADDVYNNEFIEKAVMRCEQDQLDVLLYDYYVFNDASGERVEKHMPLTFREILKGSSVFSNRDVEAFSYQMCSASGWTKIYRREFIENNNIKFQNISSANEALFNRLAVACAKRIGYENCCWMGYRIGIEGQISNLSKEHSLNYTKMGIALKKELEMRGLYERNKKSFHTYVFRSIIAYIKFADSNEWKGYYQQIKDRLTEIIGEAEGAFINSYYEHWYQNFMSLDCFEDINIDFLNEYRYIFHYENDKVEQLKDYIENVNTKLALWGYGKNGRAFCQSCEEYGLHIDKIVDNNFDNIKVFLPEILQNDIYTVLVASADLMEEIYKKAMQLNKNIVLIDVQSFFSYGMELSKCIFRYKKV